MRERVTMRESGNERESEIDTNILNRDGIISL